MSIYLIIYILFSMPIIYNDIRYQNIPDRYSIPPIFLIIISMLYFKDDITSSLISAGFIFFVFLIPIIFNMNFGGGDIRYGVLSAIIVGFPQIAYWLILASLIHLIILVFAKKEIFGFAPSMFMATIFLPFIYPFLK